MIEFATTKEKNKYSEEEIKIYNHYIPILEGAQTKINNFSEEVNEDLELISDLAVYTLIKSINKLIEDARNRVNEKVKVKVNIPISTEEYNAMVYMEKFLKDTFRE